MRRERLCLGAAGVLAGIVCWLASPCSGDDGEKPHTRPPLPSDEERAKLPPDGGAEFNRLVHEESPYLLQHARNPVDWFPWGDEAFAKARAEDKPIFLSVGYSTCHWCHVMERESFENDDIAAVLNEHFVSIKVDREERPDVDAVYMSALLAQTGHGGWPMSIFMTPDGKPFWCGTYLPPDDRFGRTGFKSVLLRVAELWKSQRNEVLEAADAIMRALQPKASSGSSTLGEATLARAQEQLADAFDARFGGFGRAPKFPRSHSLSFLLRAWHRWGDAKTLAMVETTLDAMARGGIHDHLGGGFHRYSTDASWLVPHFEKMLYDQALLARTWIEAYQATGKEAYAEVARDIFGYVLRDLRDAGGGFHAAEDADSEGVEGKFYVWRRSEILDILGTEEGQAFCEAYGVREGGNFEEEASGRPTGFNILHVPRAGADVSTRWKEARARLFEARSRRVRPHKDDKVLTDWNGLMISALAKGGRVLDDPSYVEAARGAADFVLTRMRRNGRLLHRYRAGKVDIPAFLDDYAFLCQGLLDLYESTFEARWLREALALVDEMQRLFWDEKGKGFFLVGTDAEELIAPTKELYDGAVPSGNSVAMDVLLRLGRLSVNERLEARAREMLEAFSTTLHSNPEAYPAALLALDFAVGPTWEVTLAGEANDPVLTEMRRALARCYVPNCVVAFHPTGEGASEIVELVSFLKEQRAIDGKATAYVCQNYACLLPTHDVAQMLGLLRGKR